MKRSKTTPAEQTGAERCPPLKMPGRYRLLGRINYRWDVEDDSETAVAVFSGGRRVNLKWNQAVRSGEWNEIDGSNCWATISSASLKPFSEDNRYEVHREFIDIHVPITGSETIGVAMPDPFASWS